MPGRPHHTEKFRSCVEQVIAKGHEESSAYAICTTSLQEAGEAIFEDAEAASDEEVRLLDAHRPVPRLLRQGDAGEEMEIRHLHLKGATGTTRLGMYDGREHLVVPVVALMEGVIHAINAETPEYVPLTTLSIAPQGWDGRPVMLGHPTKNGVQISANDPDVLGQQCIGRIFNSHIKGSALCLEAWIDTAKVEALGGQELVQRFRSSQPVEVSVGAFVQTLKEDGIFGGKPYKGRWMSIGQDHMAILPKGTGACSLAMGCGTHRALSHLVTAEAIEPVLEALGDLPGHEFHGNQWTSGSGGGVGTAEKPKLKGEIHLADPKDAINELVAGRKVAVAKEDVRKLIKHAEKENSPNLVNLAIEDTRVFAGGLNTPRHQMPQIPDEHQKDFLNYLKQEGISVRREMVSPMALIPSQGEISATNVAQKVNGYESGKRDLREIWTSDDRYVLDGHHRWGALAVIDVDQPKANIKMPILRMGVKHDKALATMHKFVKSRNIPKVGVKDLAAYVDQEALDDAVWEQRTEEQRRTMLEERYAGVPTMKMTECTACKGTGSKDGNPCEACDGTGELPLRTAIGELSDDEISYVAALRSAVGARNSAVDATTIQTIHDHTMKLGAICESNNSRLMEGHPEGTHDEVKPPETETAAAAVTAKDAPVEAAAVPAALTAACECQDKGVKKMTSEQKVETIKTLMANRHSGFTAADEKMLDAATDERLEAFLVAASAREKEVADLKAAEKKEMTTEEFMKAAPPEIKALISKQTRQDTERKSDLVAALKTAQEEYTESELSAKPIEELERLARMARIHESPSFIGRGVPRHAASVAEGDVYTNPPDPWASAIEARRATATK